MAVLGLWQFSATWKKLKKNTKKIRKIIFLKKYIKKKKKEINEKKIYILNNF